MTISHAELKLLFSERVAKEIETFFFSMVRCDSCEAFSEGDGSATPHRIPQADGDVVWHGSGEEMDECEESALVLRAAELGLVVLDTWAPRVCIGCQADLFVAEGEEYSCAFCGADSRPTISAPDEAPAA